MYRQKKYECGDFLDAEIFFISEKTKKIKRAKKVKETTPAQGKLNSKKAERYFVRFVHRNFTRKDLYVDLTFQREKIPKDKAGVLRAVRNYIARLRYHRKKNKLEKLKYIYVISDCDNNGNKARLHVHMIINQMDRDAAEGLWQEGYANTDKLQFDEYGVTGKSLYMARQAKGERSWGSSKGLLKPEAKVSDKFISKARAEKMARNPGDRQFFEKLYPGWIFNDCEVCIDEMNGMRFYIRMRRYEGRGHRDEKKRFKTGWVEHIKEQVS